MQQHPESDTKSEDKKDQPVCYLHGKTCNEPLTEISIRDPQLWNSWKSKHFCEVPNTLCSIHNDLDYCDSEKRERLTWDNKMWIVCNNGPVCDACGPLCLNNPLSREKTEWAEGVVTVCSEHRPVCHEHGLKCAYKVCYSWEDPEDQRTKHFCANAVPKCSVGGNCYSLAVDNSYYCSSCKPI